MEFSVLNISTIVGAVSIVSAIGGLLYAIFSLGWRIRDQLSNFHMQRGEQFSSLRIDLENQLDRHENKDQERHLENIDRFMGLEIRLARMGNGRDNSQTQG